MSANFRYINQEKKICPNKSCCSSICFVHVHIWKQMLMLCFILHYKVNRAEAVEKGEGKRKLNSEEEREDRGRAGDDERFMARGHLRLNSPCNLLIHKIFTQNCRKTIMISSLLIQTTHTHTHTRTHTHTHTHTHRHQVVHYSEQFWWLSLMLVFDIWNSGGVLADSRPPAPTVRIGQTSCKVLVDTATGATVTW